MLCLEWVHLSVIRIGSPPLAHVSEDICRCNGSEDGIGRCMLGGSSDSIWYSIFCRSGTGIRCGVRVLVVAVSMYCSMWFASCFIKCKQSLKFVSIALRCNTMFCT